VKQTFFGFLKKRIFFFFREGEEDVDTFLVTLFFILTGVLSFKNDNLFDLNVESLEYSSFSNFYEFSYFFKNSNFFKWFFDIVYIKFLTNFFYKLSNFLFVNFDRGVFEILGPLGFVRFFKKIAFFLVNLQTGFIYHYILFQLVNLLIFFFYLNDFIMESKLYVIFFLSIFSFYRFYLVSRANIDSNVSLNNSNIKLAVSKRFYGTGKRNDHRRGKSRKRFDPRRNNHFKDPDAFGPRRPKMSVLSQILFISKQIFMNFIWLFTDLLRFSARLIIGFPLFIGYYAVDFFVFRPLKYLVVKFFAFIFKFITLKISFLIFIFVLLFTKLSSKIENNPYLNASKIDFSASNFIYSNRANAYIFRKVETVNKKFPQLHEIENAFFNLHSPQNTLNVRTFNFFHPFDFRTWFWRTSLDDTNLDFYMPSRWTIKQKFFRAGISYHFLGWSNQNVFHTHPDPAMNAYYLRENWSRDWWFRHLSGGTNAPSAVFFPEDYLDDLNSAALKHKRSWTTSQKDGFTLGSTAEPVDLNKLLRPSVNTLLGDEDKLKSKEHVEFKSVVGLGNPLVPSDPDSLTPHMIEFAPDEDYNLKPSRLNSLSLSNFKLFPRKLKDKDFTPQVVHDIVKFFTIDFSTLAGSSLRFQRLLARRRIKKLESRVSAISSNLQTDELMKKNYLDSVLKRERNRRIQTLLKHQFVLEKKKMTNEAMFRISELNKQLLKERISLKNLTNRYENHYRTAQFVEDNLNLLSRFDVSTYSSYPDDKNIVSNVRNLGKRKLFFDKLNKKFNLLKMNYDKLISKLDDSVFTHQDPNFLADTETQSTIESSISKKKFYLHRISNSEKFKVSYLESLKHSDEPASNVVISENSNKIGESFVFSNPTSDYFIDKEKFEQSPYNVLSNSNIRSFGSAKSAVPNSNSQPFPDSLYLKGSRGKFSRKENFNVDVVNSLKKETQLNHSNENVALLNEKSKDDYNNFDLVSKLAEVKFSALDFSKNLQKLSLLSNYQFLLHKTDKNISLLFRDDFFSSLTKFLRSAFKPIHYHIASLSKSELKLGAVISPEKEPNKKVLINLEKDVFLNSEVLLNESKLIFVDWFSAKFQGNSDVAKDSLFANLKVTADQGGISFFAGQSNALDESAKATSVFYFSNEWLLKFFKLVQGKFNKHFDLHFFLKNLELDSFYRKQAQRHFTLLSKFNSDFFLEIGNFKRKFSEHNVCPILQKDIDFYNINFEQPSEKVNSSFESIFFHLRSHQLILEATILQYEIQHLKFLGFKNTELVDELIQAKEISFSEIVNELSTTYFSYLNIEKGAVLDLYLKLQTPSQQEKFFLELQNADYMVLRQKMQSLMFIFRLFHELKLNYARYLADNKELAYFSSVLVEDWLHLLKIITGLNVDSTFFSNALFSIIDFLNCVKSSVEVFNIPFSENYGSSDILNNSFLMELFLNESKLKTSSIKVKSSLVELETIDYAFMKAIADELKKRSLVSLPLTELVADSNWVSENFDNLINLYKDLEFHNRLFLIQKLKFISGLIRNSTFFFSEDKVRYLRNLAHDIFNDIYNEEAFDFNKILMLSGERKNLQKKLLASEHLLSVLQLTFLKGSENYPLSFSNISKNSYKADEVPLDQPFALLEDSFKLFIKNYEKSNRYFNIVGKMFSGTNNKNKLDRDFLANANLVFPNTPVSFQKFLDSYRNLLGLLYNAIGYKKRILDVKKSLDKEVSLIEKSKNIILYFHYKSANSPQTIADDFENIHKNHFVGRKTPYLTLLEKGIAARELSQLKLLFPEFFTVLKKGLIAVENFEDRWVHVSFKLIKTNCEHISY